MLYLTLSTIIKDIFFTGLFFLYSNHSLFLKSQSYNSLIFFQLFTQLLSCPCCVSDTRYRVFRAKTTGSCSLWEVPQEIRPLPLHITTCSVLKLFHLLSVLTYQQKKRIVWDYWKHGKIWHVQISYTNLKCDSVLLLLVLWVLKSQCFENLKQKKNV